MHRERRRGFLQPLWILLVFVLLVAACGAPAAPGAPAGGGSRTAPDFALKDLEGKVVRLSDFAGKVRLVDFWATWCAPCREEIPSFKELYSAYSDKGLAIVAISMDDDGVKVVKPFVEKNAIPYTNLIGDDQVVDAFGGVVGYPTAFLVGRDGRILATFVGGTPKRVFEAKIRQALGMAESS